MTSSFQIPLLNLPRVSLRASSGQLGDLFNMVAAFYSKSTARQKLPGKARGNQANRLPGIQSLTLINLPAVSSAHFQSFPPEVSGLVACGHGQTISERKPICPNQSGMNPYRNRTIA